MDGSLLLLIVLLVSVIVFAHLGYILFLMIGAAVHMIRDTRGERIARETTSEDAGQVPSRIHKRRARAL